MYNDPMLNEAFWEAFEDELIKEAAFGGFNITKGLANLKQLVQTNPKAAADLGNNIHNIPKMGIGNTIQQMGIKAQGMMGNSMNNLAMTAAMSGGSIGQFGLGVGAQLAGKGLGKLSQGMPAVSNAFNTLGNVAGTVI